MRSYIFRSAESNVGFFKSGFTTADLKYFEKIPKLMDRLIMRAITEKIKLKQ